MSRKRYSPEKVIGMLREAEVALSQGLTVGQICRQLSISEQTYYRWRKQFGGLKISQAKRMKDTERENIRLKKAVADLTLDKVILKEAMEKYFTISKRHSLSSRTGEKSTIPSDRTAALVIDPLHRRQFNL